MRIYNNELVENISTQYPKKSESNYAWGNAVGGILMTPKLRGFWPGSTVDDDGICYDVSGQGRSLTSPVLPTYAGSALYPFADFTLASGTYLQRATEDGLEIVDVIVMWTWVIFDSQSTGVITPLLSKYGAFGNRSWMLSKQADDTFKFEISSDGMNSYSSSEDGTYYEEDKWLFVLGRFSASSEVTIYVGEAKTGNSTWYKNTTGIPASIFNSSAPFQVGGNTADNTYLDGKMSLWGLANYA